MPGQGEAKWVEQGAALASAIRLERLDQLTPWFVRPVELFGGADGQGEEGLVVWHDFGRGDVAVEDGEPQCDLAKVGDIAAQGVPVGFAGAMGRRLATSA